MRKNTAKKIPTARKADPIVIAIGSEFEAIGYARSLEEAKNFTENYFDSIDCSHLQACWKGQFFKMENVRRTVISDYEP